MQVCFRHARLVLGLALFAILLGGGLRSACAQELQVETAVQVALTDDASKTRNQALSDAMGQALLQAVEQSARAAWSTVSGCAARVSLYRPIASSRRPSKTGGFCSKLSRRSMSRGSCVSCKRHCQNQAQRRKAERFALRQARHGGTADRKATGFCARALGQRSLNVELGNADRCGPGSTWPGMRLSFEGEPGIGGGGSARYNAAALVGPCARVWQFVVAPGAPPQQEAGDGVAFADRDDAALDRGGPSGSTLADQSWRNGPGCSGDQGWCAAFGDGSANGCGDEQAVESALGTAGCFTGRAAADRSFRRWR